MDIIINELSLHGQFATSRDFWKTGAISFKNAIDDVNVYGQQYLYKKTELFNAMVTPDKTYHDVLTEPLTRILDEARKYKSTLARSLSNPYWDETPMQNVDTDYRKDGILLSGTSVAEAEARSACLLSFIDSDYTTHPIIISKNSKDVHIRNIWMENQLYLRLFDSGELTLPDYVIKRFEGGKLNFDNIDPKNGFNLINIENQSEFIDAFRKFEELDWNQIATDKGFDYKTYNKNRKSKRYFNADMWEKGIKKFEVTKRNRCFGYVKDAVFYVLRFDLDHELSDVG